MPVGIKTIDFSNNKIGFCECKHLKEIFDSKKFTLLRRLNLEGNKIDDECARLIFL